MKPIDITDQRFGMLTAVRYVESRRLGSCMRTFWLFICDCGQERVAAKSDVTGGKITSCGCFRRQNFPKANENRREAALLTSQEAAKQGGVMADQLANRAAVPPSMHGLPSRVIQARHVSGQSVGMNQRSA